MARATWVAQKSAGAIAGFSPAGALLNTIRMPAGSQPSALVFDAAAGQLLVGDEGPDQNIKRYIVSGRPRWPARSRAAAISTRRRASRAGRCAALHAHRRLGKDTGGNLYVLNNPWGGSWDLGRNGATDIHAYSSTGSLRWTLQSLNFEGIAAPDPVTDGALFYGGTHVYSGGAGGTFVANTVDPFTYPADPRINLSDTQRDEHFGLLTSVGRTGSSSRPARIRRSSTSSTSTRRTAISRSRTARSLAPRSTRRGA